MQLKSQKLEAPKVKDVLEKIKPAMTEWFVVARTFIDGNYGAKNVVDLKSCGSPMENTKIWDNFKKNFAHLFTLISDGQKSTADKFTANLFKGIIERPYCGEILSGIAVLYTLKDILGKKATAQDTSALIFKWGLERKLQDIFLNEGIPVEATSVALKTIVNVLGVIDIVAHIKAPKTEKDGEVAKTSPKVVKEHAGKILHYLLTRKDANVICGLNSFDNVLWFNEEKMTDVIWYAIAVPVLLGNFSKIKELEAIEKLLVTNQKKAAYKADTFAELLPMPVMDKKSQKKKGSKGSTAEATTKSKVKTKGKKEKTM